MDYRTPEFGDAPRRAKPRRAVRIAAFAVTEAVLLTGTAVLLVDRFPGALFWAGMACAAALGLGLVEGGIAFLRWHRARRYANRYDMTDQIRRLSAEADELDEALKTEEIVDEFVDAGRRALKEERFDDALDQFQRAVELAPKQSRIYNFCGIALRRLGRLEDAAEAYSQAISIDYDSTKAHYNLAIVYEDLNHKKEALDEWVRYVDVGEVVGERDEMLDQARRRIRVLKEGLGT